MWTIASTTHHVNLHVNLRPMSNLPTTFFNSQGLTLGMLIITETRLALTKKFGATASHNLFLTCLRTTFNFEENIFLYKLDRIDFTKHCYMDDDIESNGHQPKTIFDLMFYRFEGFRDIKDKQLYVSRLRKW